MVLKEQEGQYVLKLGTMGQLANRDVIYKPKWFYEHLTKVAHATKYGRVCAELYPTHQGRDDKQLLRTNGLNTFGVFTEIGTHQLSGEDELHVVGKLRLAGPHAQFVQSMFRNDPQGQTWQFQMRALIDHERYVPGRVDRELNRMKYKSLVPQVTQVITWDLHHKYD